MSTMVKQICVNCGKEFATNNGSNSCYDCTLSRTAGGLIPEEGDFRTARIISGTMSNQQHQDLVGDLSSIELDDPAPETENCPYCGYYDRRWCNSSNCPGSES